MRKLLLPILISFYSISYAQLIPMAYQQARDLYNRLAYSEAIPLLLKECTGNNNRFLEADIMLADCYKKTNQFELAEIEYAIVCQDVRLKDDKQKLYYAQVLQINGKYKEAAAWYKNYLEKYPNDVLAQNQLKACQNPQQFAGTKKMLIKNLPFNTDGYDFGAAIFGNKLYYTSTGGKVKNIKSKDINEWTGEHFMNLYTVDIQTSDTATDKYSKASLLPKNVNTKYNEGPLCFNKEGTKVFFTRNQYNPEVKDKLAFSNDREANLSIFEADITNGNWTNIKELPFNSKQYSCGHPAFDETTNTLYFSSTMPGGYGASDIWKSTFDGGKWSKPENLGTSINTNGEEMFPTFGPDGTFYFSSDGLGGLGGLDIFSAKIDSNNISNVKNLSSSINSSYDDFSFLINKEKTVGYFSSNRKGGIGNDDIYRFADVEYKLKIFVVNKQTKAPLPDANVIVKLEKATKNIFISNAEGTTDAMHVEAGKTYNLEADIEGYIPASASKTIIENEREPIQEITIELQPLVMHVSVINAATKEPIKNAKIICNSPCQKNTRTNYTDERGTINYGVIDKCTYNVSASSKSYLPAPAQDIDITLKDTTYVVIELTQITEKAIALNNIYYDFNKWDIRPEAEEDLKMLLEFMKHNPEAIVELSSHTDARGNDDYNLKLSQKRAQSAVDWLVKRGVDPSKIKPVGYGEKQPVNKCVNNVKCTEEEHQRNRRTEFKVLNAGEIINSKSKEEILIDPCKNCLF